MEIRSCLRAAVDIKRKNEGVKMKFGVGPFRTKK